MDTTSPVLQQSNDIDEDDYLKLQKLENKLAHLDVMEEVTHMNTSSIKLTPFFHFPVPQIGYAYS